METITQVFDRSYLGVLPFERWRIVRTEEGRYRAEDWIDRNRMTDVQCAEYDKEEAFYDGCPAFDGGQPEPTFSTEALAVEWAEMQDEHLSASEEMHAFAAPGECYTSINQHFESKGQDFWAKVEAAEVSSSKLT